MKPKSFLSKEESKILETYIVDMENIIVNNILRIPCNRDTIRCKTKLMAIAGGN